MGFRRVINSDRVEQSFIDLLGELQFHPLTGGRLERMDWFMNPETDLKTSERACVCSQPENGTRRFLLWAAILLAIAIPRVSAGGADFALGPGPERIGRSVR